MAAYEPLDLAPLLAPLSDSEPCGEDLRWDALYDEIRAARQQGDRSAFEGETSAEPKWGRVVELATEALASRTKDLMLGCWLCEALLHLHGFAGVRDGLKVVNGLIENFWEQVFPRPDDGDWEPRIAPLVWLTEADRGAKLPNLLREAELAPNRAGDEEIYSYIYWEARTPKGAAGEDEEANQRRLAEASRKGQLFDDSVAATPREYYQTLLSDIEGCRSEVARLDQALDGHLGREAPGTTAIRESIAKCEDLVRRILRNKGGAEPEAGPSDEADGADAAQQAGPGGGGPLRSREDAFRRLEEIAAYLRRTEPQSPVPYLVERAVAWGRMPFSALLGELIKDEPARGHVVELLGIKDAAQ